MNENINLCEILKGHEGEIFYSPCCGYIELTKIGNFVLYFDDTFKTDSYGRINNRGKCILFPSRNQRDWNKWIKEQKPKVPKTWSELVEQDKVKFQKAINIADKDISGYNAIEKSALALLKIRQLIEVGYGGNVTNEEWGTHKIKYTIRKDKVFGIDYTSIVWMYSPIAFHTNEQAEEFLSKPENIQLLKDYFMI